jgi:Cdc6-like AAA superfamily ATPase
MNNSEKRQIAEKLSEYCSRFGSQNKAANSLKGVSAATITQVLNDNWDLIADTMWRNIASQIGFNTREWKSVETGDYRILQQLLCDSKEDAQVFAITGDSGTGKSFACRSFTEHNKNVYLLKCASHWNRRLFLEELLGVIGKHSGGYSLSEMMKIATTELLKQDRPLLILDEADKLDNHVLYLFITIYNELEERCGIVLCATNYLDKRIRSGRSYNRKGYNEIYSRIGHNCIALNGLSSKDITSVCVANGVTDKELIREVIDDSEGDLRRIRRKIYAIKKRLNN